MQNNLFKGLENLVDLDLQNNKLSAMSSQMFSHLSKLDELLLKGNACVDKNFRNASLIMAEVEASLNGCGI